MARAYEEPRFAVVKRLDGFEVRLYAPHLVAETEVSGSFGEARNAAFRRLFDYISGGNRAREGIAMTAPVTTAPPSAERIEMTVPVTSTPDASGGYVMQFMLPGRYTLQTAPIPEDPTIRVREVGERLVAVRRYSGRSSESNYREHEAQLLSLLEASGYLPAGQPWFAVYDGPFTPWFMRRNEVLVPVVPPAG
jgi:hypothetical protein